MVLAYVACIDTGAKVSGGKSI